MKKDYMKPLLQITEFVQEDIITASAVTGFAEKFKLTGDGDNGVINL